jgi:hypothetical protein
MSPPASAAATSVRSVGIGAPLRQVLDCCAALTVGVFRAAGDASGGGGAGEAVDGGAAGGSVAAAVVVTLVAVALTGVAVGTTPVEAQAGSSHRARLTSATI